jgi:rhamnosyl/mannosyltransferase
VGRRALHTAFAPFQQRFLGRASRIAVSSPTLRDSSPALAPHRHRTEVVPFGVDADEWSRTTDGADRLRARHPLPLVLFLGRLRYYKGLDVLIDAMAAVPGTLLIAGDGPKRAELERHAARSAAGRRTVFVGDVDDRERAALYHAADVFVLPSTSRAEAFGISMLEAMACGTPAVSTELGTGTSWVNRHGETGLVVPPRSSAALAAALGTLLGDRSRRREMGLAAAARVRTHFTRASMLEGLRALYDAVV